MKELKQQSEVKGCESGSVEQAEINSNTELYGQPVQGSQLAPMTELVGYRKRAQAAEQKVEELSRRLEESQQEQKNVQARLSEMERENELSQHLQRAGVNDMEVALLLVREKAQGSEEKADLSKAVSELQNERPWLFDGPSDASAARLAGLTAGRQKTRDSAKNRLSQLGRQAQQSGSRQDIRQYLRQRRAIQG
ncbi:MAG: hypothetical protein JW860_08355 [Sedimentisphaerales bacterium]|nr:hypothetical protein [Sedimentisphaerales bacterium]